MFINDLDIYIIDYPRISPPHYIYFGGMEKTLAKPLSSDLEKFVASAEKGTIIITFGQMVNKIPDMFLEKIFLICVKMPSSLEFTKFPLLVNYAKKQIFITNLFTILLYNQIQIYFHIWLKISLKTKKNLTCRKCPTQSCQSLRTSYQETSNILLIQINRFSVSNLHGRPRKNNHPFGIYENIMLVPINYTLLGLIEHHGVFIDSGHYVSYIRQSNKWYHCDSKHITETNLLTLSNNVYLMFYAKEVDLGT